MSHGVCRVPEPDPEVQAQMKELARLLGGLLARERLRPPRKADEKAACGEGRRTPTPDRGAGAQFLKVSAPAPDPGAI